MNTTDRVQRNVLDNNLAVIQLWYVKNYIWVSSVEKPLGNTGLDFHTEVQCDTNIRSTWKGKKQIFSFLCHAGILLEVEV